MAVAAELTGLNPQSIRVYEVHGLVRPARTAGGTRQFSDHDIDRLDRVRTLLGAGLNLAGVAMVVDLEAENGRLRRRIARLEREHAAAPPPEDGRSHAAPEGAAPRSPTRAGRR